MAELISIRSQLPSTYSHPSLPNGLPVEMKLRKRGERGGLRQRIRNREHIPYLPALIIGNVQSLNNKVDELSAQVKFLRDFRTSSVTCFTETWLNESISDSHVWIDGFKLIRGDRTKLSRKKKGGGVCVYVNGKWCHPNNVHVKVRSCTPNVETLTLSLRPYYLPREFTQVLLTTVYVPPSANANSAVDEISNIIHDLDTSPSSDPDAIHVINGDFNHSSLKTSNNSYYQHVSCSTRKDKTLDLCYTNIRDTHKSHQLALLGRSDHNLVHLISKYRPIVQREPVKTISIQHWTPDVIQDLRESLQCTNWDMFVNTITSVNELVETIGAYINFCIETVVPTKIVKIFPNNKQWITTKVKELINRKKGIFALKNKDQLREVQKEIKRVIKIEKEKYKRKVEEKFIGNDMRRVWASMKLMNGYTRKNSNLNSSVPKTSIDYVNDLNCFYNRFDCHDFSQELTDLKTICNNCANTDESVFITTEEEVRQLFLKVNPNKTVGPDLIPPRILKVCAHQLASIYSVIFNMYFKSMSVPSIWKRSCIVPVPKKSTLTCMNDLLLLSRQLL
ncbi:uncharacterized protein LOC144453491 [Glandiceps talaboti]